MRVQELMSRMTLDTTVRIAFGVDLGSLAPTLPHVPVGKSYETASTCSFTRFSHPFWKVEKFFQFGQEKRLKKAVADLDAFAYDVIQKRKKELPDGKFMEQVNEVHTYLLYSLIPQVDCELMVSTFLSTDSSWYQCHSPVTPIPYSEGCLYNYHNIVGLSKLHVHPLTLNEKVWIDVQCSDCSHLQQCCLSLK